MNQFSQNDTADAQGNDPGSGNPDRVTPIPEGLPSTNASSTSAVQFLLEQVVSPMLQPYLIPYQLV